MVLGPSSEYVEAAAQCLWSDNIARFAEPFAMAREPHVVPLNDVSMLSKLGRPEENQVDAPMILVGSENPVHRRV